MFQALSSILLRCKVIKFYLLRSRRIVGARQLNCRPQYLSYNDVECYLLHIGIGYNGTSVCEFRRCSATNKTVFVISLPLTLVFTSFCDSLACLLRALYN